MWHLRISGMMLLYVISFGRPAFCQEQPQQVNLCQLKNDPGSYNHRLVEVTGFVSHAFEDFTLFDPTCASGAEVWLEYGGTSKSGTMYCCGVTADRHRSTELVVEGVPISLVKNNEFSEFDKLIQPPFRSGEYGALVHATLMGHFFSGHQVHLKTGTYWNGYGHMGCCSLLTIEEVKFVSPQDRDDVDYGASPDSPNPDKTGCGYRFLTPLEPYNDLIKTQHEAETGQQWMMNDPRRVAMDALARFAGVDAISIAGLKETRKAQGRVVYRWKKNKEETYMVVVSRPYWLSFYADNADKVAWVVAAAYVSSCGKENSVIRLR
jgi:hypothetical protein